MYAFSLNHTPLISLLSTSSLLDLLSSSDFQSFRPLSSSDYSGYINQKSRLYDFFSPTLVRIYILKTLYLLNSFLSSAF